MIFNKLTSKIIIITNFGTLPTVAVITVNTLISPFIHNDLK
ncbi:hypothetical protein HMPREF0204_13189 [Chryseobacterium gleum ATCC 35910]|uniref:Uncharacterized protein n=1 Tax=Chryseobacterium gleum ATCC 35910 TaxID=525257 RepID=A0ABN0AM56_CHRGE|nr:hypothetical protein HMPREF0204_13189 [Chryseobacterium gleum ATCC 35910]